MSDYLRDHARAFYWQTPPAGIKGGCVVKTMLDGSVWTLDRNGDLTIEVDGKTVGYHQYKDKYGIAS